MSNPYMLCQHSEGHACQLPAYNVLRENNHVQENMMCAVGLTTSVQFFI